MDQNVAGKLTSNCPTLNLVGVRYLAFEDACLQTVAVSSSASSNYTKVITMSRTSSTNSSNDLPIATTNFSLALAAMSITKTLGVLTGLLATALVVVTMGWIWSCVYWQGRMRQT